MNSSILRSLEVLTGLQVYSTRAGKILDSVVRTIFRCNPTPPAWRPFSPPFGCNFGHSQFCGSRPPLASFFSPNPNLYRTYRKVLLPKIQPLLHSQAGKHLVARSLAFSPHNYHAQGRFSQVPTGYRKVLVHPCGAHAHLYSLHPAPTSCAEVLEPIAMPRLFLGHSPTL